MLPDSFYTPSGDGFVATPLTRGPWDDRFQHGGPPCALLAGALERAGDAAGFAVSRLTFELLRPIPIGPVAVEVHPERTGRQVERWHGVLRVGGEEVVRATALRIRRLHVSTPPPPADEVWPAPETLAPFTFPFFRSEVGYHRGVELGLAWGTWGTTPVAFWARPRVPLVAGRATTPLEALVTVADAQSGMGPPVHPDHFTYPNPDLALWLERAPSAHPHDWFGLEIRAVAGPEGYGVAQSALRDADGTFGRAVQSLVVTPRPA
jgi:hypothetical protein